MATNTLSVYNPIFYAQEALLALEKNLGMASLVHRGYDKQPQQRGSVIAIKSPATFSAENAPSSAQDLVAARSRSPSTSGRKSSSSSPTRSSRRLARRSSAITSARPPTRWPTTSTRRC